MEDQEVKQQIYSEIFLEDTDFLSIIRDRIFVKSVRKVEYVTFYLEKARDVMWNPRLSVSPTLSRRALESEDIQTFLTAKQDSIVRVFQTDSAKSGLQIHKVQSSIRWRQEWIEEPLLKNGDFLFVEFEHYSDAPKRPSKIQMFYAKDLERPLTMHLT
jgi:hypothetical protein